MPKKVFVGLSGGVDSAVAAALLKEQGYDVVGVFIKIWQPEFVECTWKEDRLDAMRVAVALGIPFREVDLSHEYKKEVIDRMLTDYVRGMTPNPDVLCNRRVKFGAFATWALAEGADMIATGHYARVREVDGHFELLRGKDPAKDQSYFLCRLAEADLARALFPVGAYEKSEIRALAKRFDLPVARKPDSQGLCFVGEVSIQEFLTRFIEVTKGPVVDMADKVVGTHYGAALYTIGQRHGFEIIGDAVREGPHYVVDIDTRENKLRVSSRKEDAARATIQLADANWLGEPPIGKGVEAQVRYHGALVHAKLEGSERNLRVVLDEPQIASPGQSVVFYDGEKLLGSAIALK